MSQVGGKDDIFNLRSICGPCNDVMGTMSIEAYRKKYFTKKPTKPSDKKPKKGTKKPRNNKPSYIIDNIKNIMNKQLLK